MGSTLPERRPSSRRIQAVQSSLGLVRCMMEAQANSRTGALHVVGEGTHTYVYFRAGIAIAAEEGTVGETLGRMLLDAGELTAEQYRRIIDRMTEALVANEQMRFGEVAVELGYLDVEQVRKALAEQVKRKILRSVLWPRSTWTFHESPSWVEGVGRFPTRVEPLVLAATRQGLPRPTVRLMLEPFLRRYAALGAAPVTVAERLAIDGGDARFLAALDGTRTLASLVERPEPASVDAIALLGALHMTDLLDARATPTTRGTTGKPPATSVLPRSIAPRVSERVAPPKPPPEPVKPADVEHARADARKDRLEAEQAFLRGRDHLAAERLAHALPLLRRAAELLPSALDYAVYAGWAEYATAAERGTRDGRRLSALAHQSVRQDAEFAFGLYVLGRLASDENKDELAEKYLRAASKRDPALIDAARRARILERRRTTKR